MRATLAILLIAVAMVNIRGVFDILLIYSLILISRSAHDSDGSGQN